MTDTGGELPTIDAAEGAKWWNSIPEPSRVFWIRHTATGTTAEAWELFKHADPNRPRKSFGSDRQPPP